MSSLYDVLDITKNASPSSIKQSYKAQANILHPDKDSGDAEQFKQLKHAYDVLSDPERRKRYDQWGDESPVKDVKAEAIQELAKLFQHLIQQKLKGDIIVLARKHVEDKIAETTATLVKTQSKLRNCEKNLDRVTSKTEVNLYQNIIVQQREALTNQIIQIDLFITKMEQLLEMLDDYEDTVPDIQTPVWQGTVSPIGVYTTQL